jgi:probable poly-beta-1,6-N-acetyl-D-glucosamine export protein
LIHVTSQATLDFQGSGWSHILYTALNSWGHFSVPVFIMLSGLVLTHRYRPSWDKEAGVSYMKKRIYGIAIPYVFWFLIYLGLKTCMYGTERNLSIPGLVSQLLTGSVSYHLYFIPLIMQYYLIFPFILHALKQPPKIIAALFMSSFLLQLISNIAVDYYITFDKSVLFTTYLPFFVIGVVLGSQYTRFQLLIKRNTGVFFFAALVLFILYAGSRALGINGPLLLKEYLVYSYSLAAGLFLLGFGQIMSAEWPRTCLLKKLGACSFGIYLIHPALLTLLDSLLRFDTTSVMYHAAIATKFILLLALCTLLTVVHRKLADAVKRPKTQARTFEQ